MLRFLSIDNFALIDHLEVEFQAGLNLITGETGSGKSIIVDAVGLLVGERASQEMVRQGFERARVEGIFSLPSRHPALARLKQAGIEAENEQLIVRREISTSGANKVFLNGVLSTQSLLAELGACLADIHGQHEQQLLLLPRTHLEFLDAFGLNQALLHEVSQTFHQWEGLGRQLDQLRRSEQQRQQRLDLLRFQMADIEKLQLRPGLDEELARERRLLSTAERRYQACQQSYQLLYEQEDSLLGGVSRLEKMLQELAQLDERFQPLVGKLQEWRYQMEDLALQIRDYRSGIEFSPARQEEVEARLAEIQKARRKYGASVEEMLAYSEQISREVQELAAGEGRMEELERQEKLCRAAYLEQAHKLSEKREQDARALSARVEKELAELAMEKTVFRVALERHESTPTEKGIDRAEFFFSPNPGEAPRALARIASGGELSRLILALKSILTLEDYAKTLVFDEVDAGIGGGVASTLGEKLARLARRHQVFCVTHLPQIACYADQHFHVDKARRARRTLIQLVALHSQQRIEELARMMAGRRVTETARRQARELLQDSSARLLD